MNKRALIVASLLVLAGCGGGGGGSSAVAPPPPVPSPTATPVAALGSATLTLSIPRATSAGQVLPQFVSPGTTSISIVINSVDGNTTLPAGVPRTTTVALTTTGANPPCTASPSGQTCTVPIPAPTGVVNYTFSLLDASNNVLAVATVSFTIAAGSNNPSLRAVLNGVVKTVSVFIPQFSSGTSFSGPITVNAYDASGALIVGGAPYFAPFTLTDGDTSGHTSLTNGGTTGLTVTVNSPNDVVIMNYDGATEDPFSVNANGSTLQQNGNQNGNNGNGGNGGQETPDVKPITLTGTVLDDAAHGGKSTDPNFNQDTLFFVRRGEIEQFTAAQLGWSNNHGFTLALDPATCGSGATAVVAPPASTDQKTFTITSGAAAGICKATLTGGPGGHPATKVLWFSNTQATFILH